MQLCYFGTHHQHHRHHHHHHNNHNRVTITTIITMIRGIIIVMMSPKVLWHRGALIASLQFIEQLLHHFIWAATIVPTNKYKWISQQIWGG